MVEEKEKKAPIIHWDRSQEKTSMELCLEIASTADNGMKPAEWDLTRPLDWIILKVNCRANTVN
jgi:hypothetical protein